MSHLIGIALGLYFSTFTFILTFQWPRVPCYIASIILGVLIAFAAAIECRFRISAERMTRWILLVAAFSVVICGNVILNFDRFFSARGEESIFLKLLGYTIAFFIPSIIALMTEMRAVRYSLISYWVCFLIILVIVISVNRVNIYNGRLSGPYGGDSKLTYGMHPNEIGAVARTLFATSPVFGWGGVIISLPVAFYTVLRTSSRGAAVAILLSLLITFFLKEIWAKTRNAFLITPRALAVLGILGLSSIFLGWLYADWIINDVLMLTDKTRGIGTGFTGRSDEWRNFINAWQERPIFGNGYGWLKQETLDAAEQADGGYLLILAELGVLGLLFILYSFWSIYRSVKRTLASHPTNEVIAMASFASSFFFINIFESLVVGAGSSGIGLFWYISTLCILSPDLYGSNSPPSNYELHNSEAEV